MPACDPWRRRRPRLHSTPRQAPHESDDDQRRLPARNAGVTMNASLAPGSILLHMTKGEISKLIAWADNGQYSHAAIVLDDDKIAEAVAAGVREFPLADRLAQADEFRWIDAYAPAQPLGAADLEAVRTVAKGYVGVPYP